MSLRSETEKIYQAMYDSLQEPEWGTPIGWAERIQRTADKKTMQRVRAINARSGSETEAEGEIFSLDSALRKEY